MRTISLPGRDGCADMRAANSTGITDEPRSAPARALQIFSTRCNSDHNPRNGATKGFLPHDISSYHAAGSRGVRNLRNAPNPIKPEPDQRLTLAVVAPYRTAGLLNRNKSHAHVLRRNRHLGRGSEHLLYSNDSPSSARAGRGTRGRT